MGRSQPNGFGDAVRRNRMAAGLTQEELAERTGLSVRAICDIERGRTAHPRRSSVELLARTLRLAGTCDDQHAAAAGQHTEAAWGIIPRQLPAGVRHFVGRTAELATLTRLLGELEDAGGAVAISVVGGTAGVGKTALAVRWAHLIADRFPDGQLYVNLRGYDLGQPMTAGDALAGFLRALGVPGQDIAPETDQRAAQYRTMLAGRRMLVVLDNAREGDQVRPLLPGTSGCAAVVTSRDSLASLVAWHDARRLDLDLLPAQDALDLLRALIGERVDAEPDAAATLAAQCSRLPLALRVAAELAVIRPVTPLAHLAGELADQQRRLDLLESGDDSRTGVRAVFSWSYRHLHADTARAFRLLGLHPGPDVDHYAAAALTGATAREGRRLLDLLARAHLVQPTGPSRYTMHDLLRSYASQLAAGQEAPEQRRAALTRLFDHYLQVAATAMDALFPAERQHRPRVLPSGVPAPPVDGDRGAARDWLDLERANLISMARHTVAHGWPGHTVRLASTLFRYLDVGGYYPEAVIIHTCARSAAGQTGDRAAEAEALTSLGLVDIWQDRYRRATRHLQQALAMCRQAGDRIGQARALHYLGLVHAKQGRYQQAAGHLRQALALYRETGDQAGEARTLSNLGLVDARQGRYREATDCTRQALILCRQTGDRTFEARSLANLGDVYRRQGRYQQATGCHVQALALHRETGDRLGEAHTLVDLGYARLQQGRFQPATAHYGQALALFQRIGDRSGLAESLNGLGEVLLATGQPGLARVRHAAALDLASQIGDKYQQARAHDGLACGYHATGEHGLACRHWHAALALYTDLAAPEAEQVRARLATGATGSHPGQ
ncbi:MAG TPA: tetratricopeptide repeat protein [Streptosporangiaceae bacterium]|nr:tetratricopeptide repeat protein [Streptosporangiaceae bacterium]